MWQVIRDLTRSRDQAERYRLESEIKRLVSSDYGLDADGQLGETV
jgi:hypothetical protein